MGTRPRRELIEAYGWLNPHLRFAQRTFFGAEFVNVAATKPDWDKWRPRNPTSAHWYNEARLQRYLAAHVSRDLDLGQSRTVREFIAEFRGLSGTAVQRKILTEVGCSHQSLKHFFGVERVNQAGGRRAADGREALPSKPVKPARLGIIVQPWDNAEGAVPAGRRQRAGDPSNTSAGPGTNDDAVPYIVEFAFDCIAGLEPCPGVAQVRRKIATGGQLQRRDSNLPLWP